MPSTSKDLIIAGVVVGVVFFYRLNVLAVAMTRYYESRTHKGAR